MRVLKKVAADVRRLILDFQAEIFRRYIDYYVRMRS
jgi:hypothetical protein